MESWRPLHPHWCRSARIEGVLSGVRGENCLQHGFHGSDRTTDDTITTAPGTTTTQSSGSIVHRLHLPSILPPTVVLYFVSPHHSRC
jgi:hypothetical protein